MKVRSAKQKGPTNNVHGNPIQNTKPAHPGVLKISGESFHDYYKHLDSYNDERMNNGVCLKWMQFKMPS